jgi:hypothetical protein
MLLRSLCGNESRFLTQTLGITHAAGKGVQPSRVRRVPFRRFNNPFDDSSGCRGGPWTTFRFRETPNLINRLNRCARCGRIDRCLELSEERESRRERLAGAELFRERIKQFPEVLTPCQCTLHNGGKKG